MEEKIGNRGIKTLGKASGRKIKPGLGGKRDSKGTQDGKATADGMIPDIDRNTLRMEETRPLPGIRETEDP
jgi:hypothetical protein